MEKSIQIASKRSLFSVTFGCGGSGPERAGKPELETFVLPRRRDGNKALPETIALIIALIGSSLPLMSS